jgi:CDP-diacylglycerol---serine O-phosphatidyltransferase
LNKIKRNIPNAITCGNLLCGCLAIVKVFEGDLIWAAYLVGIAAVLDFFDGFVARLLHVSSPIGKDLDSLADMVTFGVVPGFVMFKLLLISSLFMTSNPIWNYAPYLGLIIPIFSCIRLAKFNNDTRQTESFIGVNTPANSILICSLPLIIGGNYQSHSAVFILNPYLLIGLTIVMSILLVSEIPIFSFKFKSFGWKGNEIRFVFLLLSLLLLITLHLVGIPLIIVLYIVMSVINNFLTKNKASKSKQA